MSGPQATSDLHVAKSDSPLRSDFQWKASSSTGQPVTLTRSSRSGPMPIQANN